MFSQYLVRNKMRYTPERISIVEALDALTGRFTIETLTRQLDTGTLKISQATIYNTVNLMVDSGVIRRIPGIDSRTVSYEKAAALARPQLQLVCTVCGSAKDIKDPELVKLLDRRRFQSFSPEYYDLRIYGVCTRCQRRRRRRLLSQTGKNK